MFLLGKLFQIRNEDNPEEEKPFLEHLEDLRGTIVKIFITLLIGFGLCFGFRNDLMEIMRAPIDGVWQLQLDTSLHDLPVKVKAETWEKATKASKEGYGLTEKQRDHFYATLGAGQEDFLFHVQSVNLWRSTIAIEGKEAQDTYIQGIPEIEPQMRDQLLAMADYFKKSKGAGPNPDAEFRRRTVFMQSLNPTEGFMLSFKLALYAGIALTFPFLLYFILQFILPGLHKKEQKALFPALAIGFGLFLSGVFFSYLVVLPRVLEFFTTYSSQMGITNDWRIGEYISFTTQFVLIFGLAFELPVIVMTLVFLGVLQHTVMANSRAYAVVGILITAAVITPTPDILTLGLLAGPMYLLYEICIFLSWFVERKQKKKEAEELAEEKARLDKLIKEVEAEEKAIHQSLGVSAPAGLISHEEDDLHEDDDFHHDDLHDDHAYHHDDDEHDDLHHGMYDDDPQEEEVPEDLEGNGKPSDPDAEDREADK